MVDYQAEPLAAQWDEEIANEWNKGMKHVQTCVNSNVCEMVKMQ